MNSKKYHHDEVSHNLKAPNEMIPEFIRLFKPKSVVDFGCGIGTFLHAFKYMGVHDILGLDGPWVDKSLLHKYIGQDEYRESDLEKKVDLDRRYDLVLCLEVAEHLKESAAVIIVENLINAGELILFGAAIPGQGGQNHLNEQWITYWESKFSSHGYVLHDVMRPLFWDNPEVSYWYKQNMFLFAPRSYKPPTELMSVPMRKIVHYDLYEQKVDTISDIVSGEKPFTSYLKWMIFSILGRKNVQAILNFIKRHR